MTAASDIAAELRAMRDADQHERNEFPELRNETLLRAQYDRDASRRQRVRTVFASDPDLDPSALLDSAVVLHHGDTIADFADAHVLASLAAWQGVADARWWSAAAFDRLLVYLAQPQIAGTQRTAFSSEAQWRLPLRLLSRWLGEN